MIKFFATLVVEKQEVKVFAKSVLRIRDPVPFWPLDTGFEIRDDHISESLEIISWAKNT
jgi:hypothetical protein